MITKKDFGGRLRERRKAQKLGLRQMAKQTGMVPSNLSQLEQGDYWPSVPTLIALAQALECSTDFLLGLSDHVTREGGEHENGTG